MKTIFPIDLPTSEWVEFPAEGFAEPVTGVIYRRSFAAACGMPVGSIDTGCLDLDTSGLFGLCSIFNSHVPRRGALNLPFLGLSIGGRTWVLTTGQQSPEKGSGAASNEPRPPDLEMTDVGFCDDLHYWGHYPVADLEYEIDAPIGVGLRAWAPFLPGDVDRSVLPGAVFDVHLRNASGVPQSGTLAFSFFGPSYAEARSNKFAREVIQSPVQGVSVTSTRADYVLGVIGNWDVRTGGELGVDGDAWASIGERLPLTPEIHPGASVAVDFSLEAESETVVRFVLAWHSPTWNSTGNPRVGLREFRHMYTTRYDSAVAAARVLAEEHDVLLDRVLAWQAEVFTDQTLPAWLREVLINLLHAYTETSLWAVAEPPIGDWCRREDGLFSTNESPRQCPQMECLPPSFFGSAPIAYFFPQLALSTLRAEKAYQGENGAPTWVFGGCTILTGGCEMATPHYGYQATLNTPCYVTLVDRYRLLHGDDDFVREFYPSVKRSIEFMVDLNRGPDGVVSMPDRLVSFHPTLASETQWYECGHWAGIVPHVGGLHLAVLRMAERMARLAGDDVFARQCAEWIRAGSESIEGKTWAGEYYLRYLDPESDDRSDSVVSFQLDEEWLARAHNLEGIFRPERAEITLETIKRTCVAATPLGALLFTTPDGEPVAADEHPMAAEVNTWGAYPATQLCPSAPISLGLAYMFAGQADFGLELIRRVMHSVHCQRGQTWYGVNQIESPSGKHVWGTEYTMNGQVWQVLGPMQGEDLAAPSRPGGLVDRIIRAATGQ